MPRRELWSAVDSTGTTVDFWVWPAPGAADLSLQAGNVLTQTVTRYIRIRRPETFSTGWIFRDSGGGFWKIGGLTYPEGGRWLDMTVELINVNAALRQPRALGIHIDPTIGLPGTNAQPESEVPVPTGGEYNPRPAAEATTQPIPPRPAPARWPDISPWTPQRGWHVVDALGRSVRMLQIAYPGARGWRVGGTTYWHGMRFWNFGYTGTYPRRLILQWAGYTSTFRLVITSWRLMRPADINYNSTLNPVGPQGPVTHPSFDRRQWSDPLFNTAQLGLITSLYPRGINPTGNLIWPPSVDYGSYGGVPVTEENTRLSPWGGLSGDALTAYNRTIPHDLAFQYNADRRRGFNWGPAGWVSRTEDLNVYNVPDLASRNLPPHRFPVYIGGGTYGAEGAGSVPVPAIGTGGAAPENTALYVVRQEDLTFEDRLWLGERPRNGQPTFDDLL